MTQHQVLEYDVVVIGAGGAGLRAAIEAAAKGASVGLICKSLLGKAHTVMAEGGVAAALANVDDRDSWKVHFADTMRGGHYLNAWRMAELHAKEAPERVRELEGWGALMDRTPDGLINQRNFGGHAYPRLAHVGDRTGLEMIRTLQDHGIHEGIDVHMEVTVSKLLMDGARCAGALAYDRELGRFKVFKAKSVVMATGGIGRAFLVTSNSWEYTGDGHALAYEAGADVIHGTALGVGERAGNAPLDQTLVNLSLMGVISNDLTLLNQYTKKAHEYVEVALPRNYPVFGEDAFETGTGVHASAVIKAMKKGNHWLADRVYSGVPAADYGLEQVIRIGHMSGRSNIIWWLQNNGYDASDELVSHMFEVAKSQRRMMSDEEVHATISEYEKS